MQIWDVGLPEMLYAKGQMLFPELSRQLQGLLRKLLSCQKLCRETYVIVHVTSLTIPAQNVVRTLFQSLDRTDCRATVLLLTKSPTQLQSTILEEMPDPPMPQFCIQNLDDPEFTNALSDDIGEWVVTHSVSTEIEPKILSKLRGAASWSEVDQLLFCHHQRFKNGNLTMSSLATEEPSVQWLSRAIRLHGNWLLVALLWIYHARRPLTLRELDEAVNFDLMMGSDFLFFGLELQQPALTADSVNLYESGCFRLSECRQSLARDVMKALPGTVVVDSCHVYPTSVHVRQHLLEPEYLKLVSAASPSAYLARSCLLQIKYELSKQFHTGIFTDTKSSVIEPNIMAEYAFSSWSVHHSQSFPLGSVSRQPNGVAHKGEADLALEHLIADFLNSPADVERWRQCIEVPVSKWSCLKTSDNLESWVEFSPASLQSRLKISLQHATSISATLATRFDIWNSHHDSLLLKAIYENDWIFAGSLSRFLKQSGLSYRKETIVQSLLMPFPKRTDLFESTLHEICSSLDLEQTLENICSSLDQSMTFYQVASHNLGILRLTIKSPKRTENIAYLARVASRLGDLSLTEKILTSINDLEHNNGNIGGEQDLYRETLLAAVASGQEGIVGKLLEVISPVNIQTESGLTALMVASINGFSSVVSLLLKREGDIHQKSPTSGNSALHLASRSGFYKTVALLSAAEHGVGLLLRNSGDSVPLHLALAHGHLEVASLLINSMLERAGNAVLPPEDEHLKPHDLEQARVDVADSSDSDSDSNSTSDSEHTADGEGSSRNSSKDEVKCPIDIKSSGTPAFVMAASQGYLKICEMMEAKGANISLTDDRGMSALHHASKKGALDLVQFLLNCGFDANLDDSWASRTPLCYAASFGHSEVVRLLLAHDNGSAVKLNEDDAFPGFEEALSNGHYNTAGVLIEGMVQYGGTHSCLSEALRNAAREGIVSLVERLLDYGVDVNAVDGFKNSALHFAAWYSRVEVVKLLILRRANLESPDDNGFTPLMDATRRNAHSSLKLLIDAGANLTALNDSGESPLDLVISSRSKECGKLLLAKLAQSGLAWIHPSSTKLKNHLKSSPELSDKDFATAVLPGMMNMVLDSHKHSTFKDFISSLLWDEWVLALETVWDQWDISKLELGVYGTALHYAAARHQPLVVELILTRDKNLIQVDTESGKYGTALQVAVACQPRGNDTSLFLDTVHSLVRHDADLAIVGDSMAYILQAAVFSRRGPLATTLLEKLTLEVIHKCGGRHGTVLNALLAGHRDDDDFVEKWFGDLVGKYKVSVTMPANASNHGATAFHQAAERASLRIVKLVFKQEGVDIRKQDLLGRLPIHLAVWSGEDRWDIIQAIDPTMKTLWKRDHLKRSILHFVAARGCISLAEEILKVAEGTQRDVRRLLDNTDKDGWTPLHWACREACNDDMVKWLVEKGASVDKETEEGWLPQHVAIYHDNDYLENGHPQSESSSSDSSEDELKTAEDNETDSNKKERLPDRPGQYLSALCNACWCVCQNSFPLFIPTIPGSVPSEVFG